MTKNIKDYQFEEMYALLEEWTKRSEWGNHGINHFTGHLGCCSKQHGPAEECNVCGTTVRSTNILKAIDISKTRENKE